MNTNAKLLTNATMAAMLSMASAAPARAQEVVTTSRLVSLQGLDLGTAAGQHALHHRLAVAAAAVCSGDAEHGRLGDDVYLQCRKEALDEAWSRAGTLVAAAKSRSLLAAGSAPTLLASAGVAVSQAGP